MARKFKLDDLLTEKQVYKIVKEYVPIDRWQLIDSQVSFATEGISGFLGDHLKVTLYVKVGEVIKEIKLFIKRLPYDNKPKLEFIDKNNFYRREMVMFQLIEQFQAEQGRLSWCTRALVCNSTILVMPDLNVEGYAPRPQLETLDRPHVLVTVASLARFHAAFANYETRKSVDPNHPYNFLEEFGSIMNDPTFLDSPWLRAAAKLCANLLNIYSIKYTNVIPNLEDKMYAAFIEACDNLKEHSDTLNVVIHKDMWVNNIMFRYDNGVPVNAILIDFQCIRYAPPAFDIMQFLYLTTSRVFRENHELDILNYYYSVFLESLEEGTKKKLEYFKYDREEFIRWCQRVRVFGMVEALAIFPYVLMDPVSAQKTYDDPETFDKYLVEDRTEPVVAYANKCPEYKQRQLEVCEEFVDRFILNQP